jgi:hypothetical protein
MEKSVKQIWQEYAAANGRDEKFLEVRTRAFPKDSLTMNWAITGIEPVVTDWNQPPLWNEQRYFKDVLAPHFIERANQVSERLRLTDRAQALRIAAFVKRLQTEEPSSELLGLYATYNLAVTAASDAVASLAKVTQSVSTETEASLSEVGKRYYKVMHSGKAVLYDVVNDEWTSYKDCETHFAHLKVQWLNPDTGKFSSKNAFAAFKEWDKAPRYDAVVFNPRRAGHYDTSFNLWQGFNVHPEEGDDDLMVWDLLHRICDSNEAYFDYVQKWLAHMVQKPWERPGTALGMVGSQGLGKNAFVETIGMLMTSKKMLDLMQSKDETGELGKVLSTGAFGYFTSYDEVFGNFNALAGNKILLFLDEATWGGGHTQKARLKTAITGAQVIINDKHMKHLIVPNFRRFIFASNEEFYYGADPSDRRLLPLEYKTENRPSDDWFKQFYELRSNGKMVNHLLHRLLNVDLTDWEPMKALRELEIVTGEAIQSESAPDYQQWMDDIADTGTILTPRRPDEYDSSTEERMEVCGQFVTEDQLRISYQKWTGRNDMKGWQRAEFVAARDAIFGPRIQKRHEGTKPYGRNVPPQAEMRRRLDSQYRWKRNRWAAVVQEDDQAAAQYRKVMESVTLMK